MHSVSCILYDYMQDTTENQQYSAEWSLWLNILMNINIYTCEIWLVPAFQVDFKKAFNSVLSRRKWSLATTGPPDHLRQIVLLQMVPWEQLWLPWMVRFAGPRAGCKWFPGRKPVHGGDKSWLATPFNNSTMHGRLLQWRVANGRSGQRLRVMLW